MTIDDEARALAWRKAERTQGRDVVMRGYRPEEWATPADPTAILDEPSTEEIDRVLLGDLLRDDAVDALAYASGRGPLSVPGDRNLYAWLVATKYCRPPSHLSPSGTALC